MTLNLIANVYYKKNELVIGKNDDLLVKIPKDMENFKLITSSLPNSVVVMGRKTWFSIPSSRRPLENRINLILTRDKSMIKSSPMKREKDLEIGKHYFITFKQLDNIIHSCIYNVFVIGGQDLYNTMLAKYTFDNLYITEMYDNPHLNTVMNSIGTESIKTMNSISYRYKLSRVSDKHIDPATNIPFAFLQYVPVPFYFQSQEQVYLDLLKNVLDNGKPREDRTGTGTISMFGAQARFDISNYIPLVTTKALPWKQCIEELLWFLRGDTDAKILENKGIKIWSGNTSREFLDKQKLTHYDQGILGAGYGWQWRHFGARYSQSFADMSKIDPGIIGGFDQIQYIIQELKTNPFSRRIMLSAWNPPDFKHTSLQPCFTSDNLVLTSSGYKPIQNVLEDDSLYTNNTTFNSVRQIHKSSYSGQLVHIITNASSEPIVCTDTHPFLVRSRIYTLPCLFPCYSLPELSYSDSFYVEAKDIDPDEHVLCLSDVKKSTVHNDFLKTDPINWWFLGYYIANGYIFNGSIRLLIKDEKTLKKVLKLVKVYQDENGEYICKSSEWVDFLSNFGTRQEKQICGWVQKCSRPLIEYLKQGLFTENNVRVNRECAYDIQKVMYICDTNTYIQEPVDGQLYTCTIENKPFVSFEGDILHSIKMIKKSSVINVPVYNFEVDKWNTYTVNNTIVHNCHYSAQFYVEQDENGKHLSCHYIMRSNDLFLGAPWNIFSYAVLTYIIAKKTGMKPKELVFSGSDVHIYSNHIEQVKEQLERVPRSQSKLVLSDSIITKDFQEMVIEDFDVIGYFPDKPIKAKMAV